MRTYNKHPQWYNQPLRLSDEQKQDPVLVIDDFFESYHLNEVREILWNWLVEVISSPPQEYSPREIRSLKIFLVWRGFSP